jgi:hypothetical protein
MRHAISVVVGITLLATVASMQSKTRTAADDATRRTTPTPVADPSVGNGGVSSFYVWETAIPGTPGKLLRQEGLAPNLMLANASKGVRILYTSTNGLDDKTPVAVSGAAYFPKGSAPRGGWPVIAWAHGTTGIADVCAPSWNPRSDRDSAYLNSWLEQGYAIVATDYQGLGTPGGHPWNMVKPEAYSVLDSIRAAVKAFPELSNSVVIVGQSQGAHAAVSASLLSSQYAADVHLRGTVATGVPGVPPYAAKTQAPHIPVPPRVGGDFPTYNILYLLADKIVDPSMNPDDYLSDAAKPAYRSATTACLTGVRQAAQQANLTVENEFKKSFDFAVSKAAPFRQYPNPKFRFPVFVGSGLADVTVSPESQYNFVMSACYAGSTVEAHYYPGKDHGGTVNASLVDSIPFVKKLFAGEPITGNCRSVQPPQASG